MISYEYYDDIEWKDESSITKLQWKDILKNRIITNELDLKTILAVFNSPQNRTTATEISEILNEDNYHVISNENLSFSRRVCTFLNITPPKNSNGGNRWWTIPYWGTPKGDGKFFYILRPELKEAIEELISDGILINDFYKMPLIAEEIPEEKAKDLFEGAKKRIIVNAFERNPQARRLCLQKNGYTCCVCEFDFQKLYGDIGMGYIEVHHVKPLNEISKEYIVDPVNDLIPICPNCHSMLHKANISIVELRNIVLKNRKYNLCK